jgi:hypothetical protein
LKGRDTLIVEQKIKAGRSLAYYYPYLLKTGIIVFPETIIDKQTLITKCDDPNCQYCNQVYPNVCKKCATGFFLKNESCEFECGKDYIADVLRGMCQRKNIADSTNIFSKAYSTGSCENKCGINSVNDCSCSLNCKENGICCSDFTTIACEKIIDKSRVFKDCESSSPNCQFCENTLGKCNQCKIGFFLHDSKCYSKCPDDTYPDINNSICRLIKNCTVENCLDCQSGSISECKQCARGTFLMNGKCLSECPMGYRADRISWSCLEYPGKIIKRFYIIQIIKDYFIREII